MTFFFLFFIKKKEQNGEFSPFFTLFLIFMCFILILNALFFKNLLIIILVNCQKTAGFHFFAH